MAIIWYLGLISMTLLMIVAIKEYKVSTSKRVNSLIIGLSVNVILWLACEMLVQMLIFEKGILFFHEFKFFAVFSIPGMFFAFSYELYNSKKFPIRYQAITIGIPAVLWAIIFTNPWHHYFRVSMKVEFGSINIVEVINGPAYYFGMIFSYLMLLLAVIIMLKYYIEQPLIYRGQIGWLILGVLLGSLTNIGFQIAYHLWGFQFDITPLSFGIIAWIYYLSYFKYKNRYAVDYIMKTVLDQLSVGVIYLSREYQVLYVNNYLNDQMNIDPIKLYRKSLSAFSVVMQQQIKEAIESEEPTVFLYSGADRVQILQVKAQVQVDKKNRLLGHLITFRDVTEAKREDVQKELMDIFERI